MIIIAQCKQKVCKKLGQAKLNQIRLFDAKRLHYRVGMINKDDFELVKGKLKALLEVTP